MKNYIKILTLSTLWLFISCNDVGIWNLKEIEPCVFSAGFDVLKDPGCTVPCNVRFSPHELSDNNLTYKWVFSDGQVINTITAERAFSSAGDYNVTLTVSGYGCQRDSSVSFSIGEPAPLVDFTPGDTVVTAPTTLTFSEQTSNATSFEWLFDGESVGNGAKLIREFTQEDTIVVTLRATGPGGTSDKTHTVTVRPQTFPLRKFQVGTASQSEKVVGVDEAPGIGIYLMVNNKKANYLVTTDKNGMAPSVSQAYNLSGAYSTLQPSSFEKNTSGYLLTGTATKTDGNTDYFVFKARTNFTFFDQKAFFKPLSNANEDATGIVAMPGSSGYLVNGKGEWDGNKGLYLSELDQSLNASHNRLFTSDATIQSQAIDIFPDGRYILTAKSSASNQVFAQYLDTERKPTGGKIPLGSTSFTVLDIVVWDNTTAFIFGIESNQARVVKVVNGEAATPWTYNHSFRAGLRSTDGRLIFVGKNLSTGLPAWYMVHPQNGNLEDKDFSSTLILEGEAYAVAETTDGGFIIAGEGALAGEAYKTILLKTDRNGLAQ